MVTTGVLDSYLLGGARPKKVKDWTLSAHWTTVMVRGDSFFLILDRERCLLFDLSFLLPTLLSVLTERED